MNTSFKDDGLKERFRAKSKPDHLLLAIILNQDETHDLGGVLWIQSLDPGEHHPRGFVGIHGCLSLSLSLSLSLCVPAPDFLFGTKEKAFIWIDAEVGFFIGSQRQEKLGKGTLSTRGSGTVLFKFFASLMLYLFLVFKISSLIGS